jgi:hypothetical protein
VAGKDVDGGRGATDRDECRAVTGIVGQRTAILGATDAYGRGPAGILARHRGPAGKLANRIGTEDTARVRGSLSARIPIPSIEEQRGVQLTNARADAELAGELRDMHAASVADHESLVDDFNVYLIRVIPVDDDKDAGPLPFGVTGHPE